MAGISKVTFNGQTLMDISSDTVVKEKLAVNTTAHAANGDQIVGTFDVSEITGFYVDENGQCYLYYRR